MTLWMKTAAGVVLATLFLAAPAAAQSIEGRVTESLTQQPVAGAQVQLLDTAGVSVANVVTIPAGPSACERLRRASTGCGRTAWGCAPP